MNELETFCHRYTFRCERWATLPPEYIFAEYQYSFRYGIFLEEKLLFTSYVQGNDPAWVPTFQETLVLLFAAFLLVSREPSPKKLTDEQLGDYGDDTQALEYLQWHRLYEENKRGHRLTMRIRKEFLETFGRSIYLRLLQAVKEHPYGE